MNYIYCCLHRFPEKGSLSSGSGYQFTLTYAVCLDDPSCGPAVVLRAPCLPPFGSQYNPYQQFPPDYAQCEVNAFATSDTYTVRRASTDDMRQITEMCEGTEAVGVVENLCQSCCWLVDVTYTEPPVPSGDDPNVDPCDPATWCPIVTATPIIRDVLAEGLEFRGVFSRNFAFCDAPSECSPIVGGNLSNDCIGLNVGQCVSSPLNSAGQDIIDPPTCLEADIEFGIQTFSPCFENLLGFETIGEVNCLPWRVAIPCRCLDITFPAKTVQISSVLPESRELEQCQGGLPYWAITWNLIYRRCGHRWDLLDQGTKECTGDCDTSNPNDSLCDITCKGVAATDPVPLNGAGVRQTVNLGTDRFFLRYEKRCEPDQFVPPFAAAVPNGCCTIVGQPTFETGQFACEQAGGNWVAGPCPPPP